MTATNETKLKALALKLFEINAFKFGDFKMKVGINSPVYFDLRVIVSYPDVMDTLADLIHGFMRTKKLSYDHVCGVPYTALPIATLISVKDSKPMLIRRKEAKDYGTKKLIEGKFGPGETCLIIEDVVTSGSSIMDTVKDLRKEGLEVTDAIVVVDREQGGALNTENNGVKMHSLFTLSFLLQVLLDAGKIEKATVDAVAKYIQTCQIKVDGSFMNADAKVVNKLSRTGMTFDARADLTKSEVTKNLFKLMSLKKTNLCVAADLTKTDEILTLAKTIGPHICILKLHVDIIEDFTQEFIASLKNISKMHNFLLMEDRKFADIGNTVALQFTSGVFRINEWADLVTCHSLPGQHVLKGLKSLMGDHLGQRGVFLLAELSSAGNLITADYTQKTMKMATEGADIDIVTGVVSQNNVLDNPGLIQLTPGVKLEQGGDELGQQYNTPLHVVKEKGADIAVVGRGIYQAKNMTVAAENYKNALWGAYCERVGITSD
ncbi:uridine 5'-monophosphate synthase [Culicoides brevitarsis]|uniref:uridine 5'-monophosphate synthase n=1 Tax=Culicoides brevitarsis TaxID=469753 RepID=UPI00307C5E03